MNLTFSITSNMIWNVHVIGVFLSMQNECDTQLYICVSKKRVLLSGV